MVNLLFLHLASEQSKAQFLLGAVHLKGDDVPRNVNKEFQYYC